MTCQKTFFASILQLISLFHEFQNMIWKTEECRVSKNTELKIRRKICLYWFCSAFVYFADFLIAASCFNYLGPLNTLARFRLFLVVLDRFSLFLTSVSTLKYGHSKIRTHIYKRLIQKKTCKITSKILTSL